MHAVLHKDKSMFKKIAAAIIYTVLFVFLLLNCYAEKVNRDLSDSMIRLHIVANSNSTGDQALKYRVRDAVVGYMSEKAKELKNKGNAISFIRNNIREIEQVANSVLVKEGINEYATVSFGKYPFPSKRYGNIILPAGFYDALKIEIGEAKGENWWCVMFPPLCFTEDAKGELDEEYLNILKEELSDEEMKIIINNGEKEIPVEIKFKIVEIFQESKIKLTGLFRGLLAVE
ncbi:stage II sporulation protein R [Thermoclostridium stercorarium]|uniref:stage II sporulation protein R n=1 Tax=Thermoclostridium stercorarium TaxID=1510 RepID=UPI002248C946|nr:stage II sporulation protein R [Thermoclostridium stercorarium]UZQ85320.1 stage II sporulation protein R [Thermoclostridium stercorarium]